MTEALQQPAAKVYEAKAPEARPGPTIDAMNPSPRNTGLAFARISLGAIMLAHGLQKTAGMWGGHGWEATIESFQSALGIPAPLAAIAILTELVGGALLVIGYLARPAALLVAIEMIVAAALVHAQNGFFMNWEGKAGIGHGVEMNLALIGLALAVLFDGAGRFSLDALIVRRAIPARRA